MGIIKIKDEKHWHELRKNNIGGSDAPSLFNQNKFQSYFSLWHKKRDIDADHKSNERTVWGHRFEAPIAEGLAIDMGWMIKKAEYYQHDNIKGMGCTPDFIINNKQSFGDNGITINGKTYFEDGVFEIKNLEYFGYFAEFTRDESNYYIECQIQHQLACTGLKWGALGYKLPGQTPLIQLKTRDDAFIKALENEVERFWESKECPPPDGGEDSSAIVKDLYIRQKGKIFIDLSTNNQLPILISELNDLKNCKKPLSSQLNIIEKDEKSIKNQIMVLSQGAQIIKFQGGSIEIDTINKKESAASSYQKLKYKLDKENDYE